MALTTYSILLGAPNGRRRFSARDEKIVTEITERFFPRGFTLLRARGSWFDAERGARQNEDARQVIICTRRPSQILPWAKSLCGALGQKEILVLQSGRGRVIKAPARRRR